MGLQVAEHRYKRTLKVFQGLHLYIHTADGSMFNRKLDRSLVSAAQGFKDGASRVYAAIKYRRFLADDIDQFNDSHAGNCTVSQVRWSSRGV